MRAVAVGDLTFRPLAKMLSLYVAELVTCFCVTTLLGLRYPSTIADKAHV
jgi:hypothetical protein